MNAAIADSLLALLLATAAVLRDAGGDAENATGEKDLDDLFELGDADVIEAYSLNVHGDDNSTWAKAMKSDDAN
eukprot:1051402-Pleurochrysis_carterae.AAC.1